MAAKRGLPHIQLSDYAERYDFKSKTGGGAGRNTPVRKRSKHYEDLKRRLSSAWAQSEGEQAVYQVTREGIYLEFKGEPGYELPISKLERLLGKDQKNWIRVRNVRQLEGEHHSEAGESQAGLTSLATVFIPHVRKEHFFKALEQYAGEQAKSGKPKNSPLIDVISEIRKALEIESFWTDDSTLIPDDEPEWCEVWLSGDSDETQERFERLLNAYDIEGQAGALRFPERSVKLVRANRNQLVHLSRHSDDIAEYRRAKETAAFWMDQRNADQAEWVGELLSRTRIATDSDVSVCVLDTGVNNGHPLLKPVLSDENCHSWDLAWGVHDHNGHGTLMAGATAFGDLRDAMTHRGAIAIRHLLESVKVLPPPPAENKPELWGYITAQAVSLAEIQAPQYKRVVCMAISATDTRDEGRPSSWSAELDQIAAGSEDGMRRLLIVCAGNATVGSSEDYPRSQIEESVHDPGQSWNAVTVGAYTELDVISDKTMSGYTPVAPSKGLSPYSTTSRSWDNDWPVKPEILLEGGNVAQDSMGFVSECDDLSLLSTYHDPQTSHFYPFCMTSAATAQAAWMAAQIQARYNEYWPETIRALLVHSADWTDTLKQQFLAGNSKGARKELLRTCGYGVPSLERAIYSASNALTLVAQAEIQPFDKDETGKYRTRDMHLYDLPWPKDALQNLQPDALVSMRVTLSYFVEPGPGEIGWKDRYRYPSHGLRFDVKSPTETKDQFLRRVNKAAVDASGESTESESTASRWYLGTQARDKGSIHSDIWEGSAADLASSNLISIRPVIGWWRERKHLGKWNRKTRYSLIVSITTPDETVDIYTPVANQVGIRLPISITT